MAIFNQDSGDQRSNVEDRNADRRRAVKLKNACVIAKLTGLFLSTRHRSDLEPEHGNDLEVMANRISKSPPPLRRRANLPPKRVVPLYGKREIEHNQAFLLNRHGP